MCLTTRVALAQSAPTVTFSQIMAFSLPALRLEYKLKRGEDNNETFALPYESFEPFSTCFLVAA